MAVNMQSYFEQIEIPKVTSVIIGKVLKIEADYVLLDVFLKSEAYVPRREFEDAEGVLTIKEGDEVEVILEALENGAGETYVSREKARRAIAWKHLVECHENSETVQGRVSGRVKGGFSVSLGSVKAFLPASLIDLKPGDYENESGPLYQEDLELQIVKVDEKRNNIVVSRKAVLIEQSFADSDSIFSKLKKGDVISGVVKNLTDYGAFIDLGGMDGLLHITDISWKRIKHPSDHLTIGQKLDVQVLNFDQEKRRISLGIKQLQSDPWKNIVNNYPVGTRCKGVVTTITDYGCFVEVDKQVEGLVHVSEFDWVNRNIHPSKVVSEGQEVEVQVLDLDNERRRVSFGLKQCKDNPWITFSDTHSVGDVIEGKIKSITDFGLFVGVTEALDGLVHLNDLSWNTPGDAALKSYEKGQNVTCKMLAIDVERERISLGIKQLTEGTDKLSVFLSEHPRGTSVQGTVVSIDGSRVHVDLGDDIRGVIAVSQFRNEVKENDTIEAYVVHIDKKINCIQLSMHVPSEKYASNRKKETTNLSSGQDSNVTIGHLLKDQLKPDSKE